jgi:putative sterol carrier protein
VGTPDAISDLLAADLRDADPTAVARLIAETDDDALGTVLSGELRGAVLDEIFRRFPEYLDPDRTAGVSTVIEFRIAGGADGADHYLLVLEDGRCLAGRHLDAEPRVSLELGPPDFLKLVTGNANPAILFVSGRLRIHGDELFAVEIASLFRVPGVDREGRGAATEIDPSAVDAIEMARAVAATPDDQLRSGMRSAFRDMVLDEIFRRFPEYFRTDRAQDLEAGVKWRITGGPGDEPDRYFLEIADGSCRVVREAAVQPRVTITIDGADFLKLVTGNANPPMLFLRGRLRVSGDLAFAARLMSFFEIPSVRSAPDRPAAAS